MQIKNGTAGDKKVRRVVAIVVARGRTVLSGFDTLYTGVEFYLDPTRTEAREQSFRDTNFLNQCRGFGSSAGVQTWLEVPEGTRLIKPRSRASA